jgi:hypothetical protein
MSDRTHALAFGSARDAANELERPIVALEDLRMALVNALRQIEVLEVRLRDLEDPMTRVLR